MRLVRHPEVHSDVSTIMEYYERVASPELADDFYSELRRFMLGAAERPESFSIRELDLRRASSTRHPLSLGLPCLVTPPWTRLFPELYSPGHRPV